MIEHMDNGFREYLMRVQRFESVTEFYRHCEKNAGAYATELQDNDFYGHNNVHDAVRYCEHNIGEEHLRAAKELVNKIDTSFRDRERVTWQPSPMGAYPIVPEYLAGEPFPMRQKAMEPNDNAPIRYYIECAISQGTTLPQIERRATAIAAMIMRSAEERPVELYAFFAGKGKEYTRVKQGRRTVSKKVPTSAPGSLCVIPIATHPIDLHSTIVAFATREFTRCLTLTAFGAASGESNPSITGWAYGSAKLGECEPREREIRRALALDPQDVVMQGGYLADAAGFECDPVQWVHNQIEKQRALD